MSGILKYLFYVLRVIIALVLPFVLFIRSAVYVHKTYELPGYFSVLIAGLVLAVVLFFYLTIGYKLFFNRIGSGNAIKQRMIFLMIFSVGLLIHLLFFVSNKNVKSSDIKSEFLDMHPILRLATSIFIKFDKELVMTDISRESKDYGRMGLPTNHKSLHYPQKDGYAYALDLRTRDKSALLIFTMTWYYKLLGFETLRHVGTADHLHVALYCHSGNRR